MELKRIFTVHDSPVCFVESDASVNLNMPYREAVNLDMPYREAVGKGADSDSIAFGAFHVWCYGRNRTTTKWTDLCAVHKQRLVEKSATKSSKNHS